MRSMRLFAAFLLLACLPALLAGCGGGSGTGSAAARRVTFQLDLPASGRKAGRAAIQTVQSALVEVYDGTQRIGVVKLTAPASGNPQQPLTATLDLPRKPLTFHANGFALATPPDYVTNPANGQLEKGTPAALAPLAPVDASGASTDPRPVAHATAAVDVSALPNPPIVHFTWNNTIASLLPITPQNIPGATDRTLIALNNGVVDLSTTIQAKTSDGYFVMVSPGAFTAQIDPSDTAGAQRAVVASSSAPPAPPLVPGFAPTLTPQATGLVRVILYDNDVNNLSNHPAASGFAQQPIAVTVTYTIVPVAGVTQTYAVNTAANSSLLSSLPYYARSVTFALTQDSLPLAGGQIQDNPNTPADTVTVTRLVQLTFDPATGTAVSRRLTDAANAPVTSVPMTFTQSNHPLTLTVTAWSRPDGSGAKLAGYSQSGLAYSAATQEVTLTSNVASLAIVPVSAPAGDGSITVNLSSAAPTNATQNTFRLQVAAVLLGSDATRVLIDPRTVNVTPAFALGSPAFASLTVSYPTAPPAALDSGGNPYALFTFSGVSNPPAALTGTVSVSDKTFPSVTAATQTVNLTGYTPSFILQ